jgi:hypothetical protein
MGDGGDIEMEALNVKTYSFCSIEKVKAVHAYFF